MYARLLIIGIRTNNKKNKAYFPAARPLIRDESNFLIKIYSNYPCVCGPSKSEEVAGEKRRVGPEICVRGIIVVHRGMILVGGI